MDARERTKQRRLRLKQAGLCTECALPLHGGKYARCIGCRRYLSELAKRSIARRKAEPA